MFKPHVTVAVIVRYQQQYLLVEEEVTGVAVLNQPAGHLEQGESLIAAAERELLEETGLSTRVDYFSGIYLYPVAREEKTFLRVCFVAELDTKPNNLAPLDADISKLHWLTLEQIRERSSELRSPMVLSCIEDMLKGNKGTLDLLSFVVKSATL